MDKFFKNSLITVLTEMLFFISGFVILIIISRVLGPEGKGIYALIVLIPGILLSFGSFGIESANVFLSGKKDNEINDIVSNSIVLAIFLGILIITVFGAVSHFSFFNNFISLNKIPIIYLWAAVLLIPFLLFLNFFRNIIRGTERITQYNVSRLLDNLFQLLIICILVFFLDLKMSGAIFSYIGAIILSSLVVLIMVLKITSFKFRTNRLLMKKSFSYGLKIYLASIVSFLNYRFDVFLVALFLNPLSVGLYSISVGTAERLFIIPNALATVLFPRIVASKSDDANVITAKVSRHTVFIMIITSIAMIFLAGPFVNIFFGSSFSGSVAPLLILLPGVIAFGIGGVLAADLSGRGRPEFAIYSASSCLVVNIILNVILIPKMGINGAALSSSVAYWVDTLVIIFAFLRISKKPLAEFLLIKKKDLKDYVNVAKSVYNTLNVNLWK